VSRPAVPAPTGLDPALDNSWTEGSRFVRVYERAYGPLNFNPTDVSRRFRPVRDDDDNVIATAYGAIDVETALAEVLLRGVETLSRGVRRRVYRKQVNGLDLVALTIERDLTLVRLHGLGLQRLGLQRADIIDCDEADYAYTAEWAQALFDCDESVDGIAWTSRQNDSARAAMLWAGRVDPAHDLREHDSVIALDEDPGLELARRACALAGIDFEA
jgi:RES domain